MSLLYFHYQSYHSITMPTPYHTILLITGNTMPTSIHYHTIPIPYHSLTMTSAYSTTTTSNHHQNVTSTIWYNVILHRTVLYHTTPITKRKLWNYSHGQISRTVPEGRTLSFSVLLVSQQTILGLCRSEPSGIRTKIVKVYTWLPKGQMW